MNKLAEKLKLRRQALVSKSQAERMLLILHGSQLKHSLTFADMGVSIAGKLTRHPILSVGLLVAISIIKPRSIMALLKKALSVWQIWQLVAPGLKKTEDATSPDHRS